MDGGRKCEWRWAGDVEMEMGIWGWYEKGLLGWLRLILGYLPSAPLTLSTLNMEQSKQLKHQISLITSTSKVQYHLCGESF